MTTLLLVALLAAFALFIPLSRRAQCHSTKTFVDAYIPVLPIMVVPYLGLFVFVPYSLLAVVPTGWGIPFLLALVVAMWSGSAVWYLYPTGMKRPKVQGRDPFSMLMRLMYRIDGPCNNFPSSHVFLSVICGHYLAVAAPDTAGVTWIIASLVAASTVFVKQHNALDILGGIFWAVGAIVLAHTLVG